MQNFYHQYLKPSPSLLTVSEFPQEQRAAGAFPQPDLRSRGQENKKYSVYILLPSLDSFLFR